MSWMGSNGSRHSTPGSLTSERNPGTVTRVKLDLGNSVTITRHWVSSPPPPDQWTAEGWVALVTGTDPKYELRRTFAERDLDGSSGKRPTDLVRYILSGPGLYEFRKLGEGQALSGFFLVEGRRIRVVAKEDAFDRAARMR